MLQQPIVNLGKLFTSARDMLDNAPENNDEVYRMLLEVLSNLGVLGKDKTVIYPGSYENCLPSHLWNALLSDLPIPTTALQSLPVIFLLPHSATGFIPGTRSFDETVRRLVQASSKGSTIVAWDIPALTPSDATMPLSDFVKTQGCHDELRLRLSPTDYAAYSSCMLKLQLLPPEKLVCSNRHSIGALQLLRKS